jgi:hypothetical protein
MGEVDHFPDFGCAGAMGGGEVFVGNVVDGGQGGVLKIVQSIHGYSFRVSAQDQGGGDLFAGVGGPQLLVSGGVEVFAVGEGDIMLGHIVLPALFCCWHKKSLESDE